MPGAAPADAVTQHAGGVSRRRFFVFECQDPRGSDADVQRPRVIVCCPASSMAFVEGVAAAASAVFFCGSCACACAGAAGAAGAGLAATATECPPRKVL
jgi:hypothetical protein